MTKIPELEGGPDRKKSIEAKIQRIPRRLRAKYLKAVTRTSRVAAMAAFCDECVGYQSQEVPVCTALDCPLWAWRRRAEDDPDEVTETPETDP